LSGQDATLLAQVPVNATSGTEHIGPWLNSIGEHSPRISHLFGMEHAIKAVVEHLAIKSFPVVATATPDGPIKIQLRMIPERMADIFPVI
jgi:hypothetical protein